MMKKILLFIFFVAFILSGFSTQKRTDGVSISQVTWGKYNCKEIKLITLKNRNGMVLKVTNYGATITSIIVPDSHGKFENVVIGFDSLQQYIRDRGLHGRTVGRYANRIGGAQFKLNGETFRLTANNGPNSLHGGPNGFSSKVFDIDKEYSGIDSAFVALHYLSPDMEEGFPGNLTLYLDFVLTNNNEVKILYRAVTDKPTVVNFTNHSYFNLTGNKSPVLGHRLKINADSITALGPDRLPNGIYSPVNGTEYDFKDGSSLKDKLNPSSFGFDVNYILCRKGNELSLAAEVCDTENGRILDAYTTEPGMQLFTLKNSICLEMQHFPDSPNKQNFPKVILNPGETYRQTTVYRFSVQNSR